MEDSRLASYSQASQAHPTLEAAVGAFDTTTHTVTFAKDVSRFFQTTSCNATLLYRVIQTIVVTTFLDRTILQKLTLSTNIG